MSTATYDQLLVAVRDMSGFAERIDAKDQARSFQKLHERLQAERRPSEGLKDDIFQARGLASFWIPNHIAKQRWTAARKKELEAEFFTLRCRLEAALMPPKPAAFPSADIQGLEGNTEYTKVYGDPEQAPEIAKRAMDLVVRFSTAVFGRDIETAYGLCANELRTWMSVKRFCTELVREGRPAIWRQASRVQGRACCRDLGGPGCPHEDGGQEQQLAQRHS